MPIKNNEILKLLPYILLTGFLVWIFPTAHVEWRSDSGWYLINSFFVLREFDYPGVSRGPVFSGLGALALWISDENILAVNFIPRVSAIICLFGVFFLVRQYYGVLVGVIVACITSMTSQFIESSAMYHVDITLAAFLIWTIYFWSLALKKESPVYGLVSGIIFAVAFLTKELAIVLATLPIVSILLLRFSVKIRPILFFYGASLVSVVPWALHVWFTDSQLGLIFGRHLVRQHKFGPFLDNLIEGPLSFVSTIAAGFGGFFEWYFEQGLVLLVAGVVGFAWLVYRAWQHRDPHAAVISSSVISFSPFLIYFGATKIADRQLTTLAVLAVACATPVVSWLCLSTGRWLRMAHAPGFASRSPDGSTGGRENRTRDYGYSLIIAFVVCAVTLVALARQKEYSLFNMAAVFQPVGQFNRSAYDAGKWLRENLPHDRETTFLNFGPSLSLLEFGANLEWEDHIIQAGGPPLMWNSLWAPPARPRTDDIGSADSRHDSAQQNMTSNGRSYQRSTKTNEEKRRQILERLFEAGPGKQLLFLWLRKRDGFEDYDCFDPEANTNIPPFDKLCQLDFYTANWIRILISQNDASYIVVEPRYGFLIEFFEKSPAFDELAVFDYGQHDRTAVYQVLSLDDLNGTEFEPQIGLRMPAFLNGFKRRQPDRYKTFQEEVMGTWMGLSKHLVSQITQGNLKCFEIRIRSRPAKCEL